MKTINDIFYELTKVPAGYPVEAIKHRAKFYGSHFLKITANVPGYNTETTELLEGYDSLELVAIEPNQFGKFWPIVKIPFDKEYLTVRSWTIADGIFDLLLEYKAPDKYTNKINIPHNPSEKHKEVLKNHE